MAHAQVDAARLHGPPALWQVPILERMLGYCGGEHCTVGVCWDYASLPQPPRTAAEECRFEAGLRLMIGGWFAHPCNHSGPEPAVGRSASQ
jgi:hypothetical protein